MQITVFHEKFKQTETYTAKPVKGGISLYCGTHVLKQYKDGKMQKLVFPHMEALQDWKKNGAPC